MAKAKTAKTAKTSKTSAKKKKTVAKKATTAKPVESKLEAVKPVAAAKKVKVNPLSEYLIQTYFDLNKNKYIATAFEFPEVISEAQSRDEALITFEDALYEHIDSLKSNSKSVPTPFNRRSYPESLEIPISQGMYKRLDQVSKQERIALETLVTELISSGLSQREVKSVQRPQRNTSHANNHNSNNSRGHHRNNNRNRNDNRRQFNRQNNGKPQQGQGQGQGGKDDNFLEYVRSLEKRGGNGRGGNNRSGGNNNNWNR